ncbi:MAG: SRPBCC family protein [Pedobacter sp.]|nr:SRPBCC family protein [Pedobacter sp.]
MKSYQLIFRQKFPVALETIWEFFSSPFNLEAITPESMTFKVTSKLERNEQMYAGMLITYKVAPIAGIKLNWMTEITHVVPKHYFIDEQRFGPYKFWHHQHQFREIPGGVEMTDIITYGLPFGWLGQMANQLFVAHKLREIFEYRRKKTLTLFGALD